MNISIDAPVNHSDTTTPPKLWWYIPNTWYKIRYVDPKWPNNHRSILLGWGYRKNPNTTNNFLHAEARHYNPEERDIKITHSNKNRRTHLRIIYSKTFYLKHLRDKANRAGHHRKNREDNPPCLSTPERLHWEVILYQIYRSNGVIISSGT